MVFAKSLHPAVTTKSTEQLTGFTKKNLACVMVFAGALIANRSRTGRSTRPEFNVFRWSTIRIRFIPRSLGSRIPKSASEIQCAVLALSMWQPSQAVGSTSQATNAKITSLGFTGSKKQANYCWSNLTDCRIRTGSLKRLFKKQIQSKCLSKRMTPGSMSMTKFSGRMPARRLRGQVIAMAGDTFI